MAGTKWKKHPHSHEFSDPLNWVGSVPPTGALANAVFGPTSVHRIDVTGSIALGGWVLAKGAGSYVFDNADGVTVSFEGAGIAVRDGRIKINNLGDIHFDLSSSAGKANIHNQLVPGIGGQIDFFENSDAGQATILNQNWVFFHGNSSADHARVTNRTALHFFDHSTADKATIIAEFGSTIFYGNSNAGHARLIAKDSYIEFQTSGYNGDSVITAGSIEGRGQFLLGDNTLYLVGNRSTTVGGEISGGWLSKGGKGTLTLRHEDNNIFEIQISKGTLNVAAHGATGIGGIYFDDGTSAKQVLKIQNAAFDHGVFNTIGSPIIDFGRGDTIDLPGLKYHQGARINVDDIGYAKIKSGHVTKYLYFDSWDVAGFKAVPDGHGGTKIVAKGAPHARAEARSDAADHGDSFQFKPLAASTQNAQPDDTGDHGGSGQHEFGPSGAAAGDFAAHADAGYHGYDLHLAKGGLFAGDFVL